LYKEELIKFWKSSLSRSRNILQDSLTLRDVALLGNLVHMCGKTDQIFMKICIIDLSLDKQVFVKFWKSSWVWIQTRDAMGTISRSGQDSPWQRSMLFKCSCYVSLLSIWTSIDSRRQLHRARVRKWKGMSKIMH